MDAKDVEIARLRTELEKAQQEVDEVLESTKDIEAQLEQDVTQAEKELNEALRKSEQLKYDLHDQKERHYKAQARYEKEIAGLHKELAELRSSHDKLRTELRDEELKHDDLERQERIITTSYQDMESKYHEVLEKNVDLECEVNLKKHLEVDCQRLRDEVRDLRTELLVNKLRTTSVNDEKDSSSVDGCQTLISPQSTGRSIRKETQFLKSPDRQQPRVSPSRTGIPVPQSRLTSSKSVRDLQTLSSTITALREKMKAARAIPTGEPPLIAPKLNSAEVPTKFTSGIMTETTTNTLALAGEAASLSPKRLLAEPRRLSRRQSGIPTPGRARSTLAQREDILNKQDPFTAKSQARQSLTFGMNEHRSPDKFDSRSGSRRRSLLAANLNLGYPQSTADHRQYLQKGEIRRPSKRLAREDASF